MTNNEQSSGTNWNLIFFAWLVAIIATLGSLFFSEVMEFPPCTFCWYQRILMYPLVFIFLVGLFPFDKNVVKYAFPLAIVGWLIALYHNLLQYGIIPESAAPCSQGVPCSAKYISLFGILTIPMLSFIAFSIILTLLIILKKRLSS
jgi:disulfide bond formation protein DsbB